MEKSLLAFLNALCGRWWQVFGGVRWPILALRYSPLLGSFSKRLNNISLVSEFLTPLHRLFYCKLPWPRTLCHSPRISVWTLFCPLAPSLWYCISIVICEKYCGSFTSLIALICRLVLLIGVELEKVRRISLLACGFIWSWCICYFTKLCQLGHNF